MQIDVQGNDDKLSKNTIGGAGGTATPGGYNLGTQFAASGNARGASGSPVSHIEQRDLRGGTAQAGGGYNQGNTFAAQKSTAPLQTPNTSSMGKAARSSAPSSANAGTGYNLGDSFAAAKK